MVCNANGAVASRDSAQDPAGWLAAAAARGPRRPRPLLTALQVVLCAAATAAPAAATAPAAGAGMRSPAAGWPPRSPSPPPSCCFSNPNLSKPCPSDPSRPLGWTPVAIPGPAAGRSRFQWTGAAAGTPTEPRALQIVGGVGRWSTELVASAGQTLSVRFEFRAANVSVRARPKYGGCARLSAVLSSHVPEGSAAPTKASNASHLVVQQILCYGQAVRDGRWMQIAMGDFVVPSPPPERLWFSLWFWLL